jgi:hypothetical protein
MSDKPLFQEIDEQERRYGSEPVRDLDTDEVAAAETVIPASALTVATGQSLTDVGAVPQAAPAVSPGTPGVDEALADAAITDEGVAPRDRA